MLFKKLLPLLIGDDYAGLAFSGVVVPPVEVGEVVPFTLYIQRTLAESLFVQRTLATTHYVTRELALVPER